MEFFYKTNYGMAYCGRFEEVIKNLKLDNKVQLILTSPPFPLNKKKKYGNLEGNQYLEWLKSLAPVFSDLLTDDGSLVVELGNAWEKGRPVQSLLTFKSLLALTEESGTDFRLIQEFVCHNPARLPSPAQWVTVNRIRAIDSFTHIWWLAKSDFPKADNKKILRPYSKSMNKLIERGEYNSGKRPSEHSISRDSFLKKHEGSISHNVLEIDSNDEEARYPYAMQKISNTKSQDIYLKMCRRFGLSPHPARMPMELAGFFIEFLTDEGDLVFDPFAGSNTTGFCADFLNRRWVAVETQKEYMVQSAFRFEEYDRSTFVESKLLKEQRNQLELINE